MQNRFSALWAVLASLTWGLSYALDEKVLKSISPFSLLVVNALITLLLIGPVLFLKSDEAGIANLVHSKSLGLIIFTSILAVLANLFIFLGIKHLGASSAAIIEISYPFFVVLFSALLWKERFSPSFFVGAALLFCGSWIISRGRH